MNRKTYPSDISRGQFAPLLPLLESARKRTAPRQVDLYDVFCAILYLQRTGCSWRALPGDFPKWRIVHSYFQRWTEPRESGISILEEALKKNQVVAERRKQGRHEATTFLIIDAQSVKNTDTAMEKGYDAGKKVSGIKRHIAVDTQGLPHALAVTTADVTDRKGCLLALKRELDNLGAIQKILADGGYTGQAFASSVQELIGAEVEIAKRNELHRFAVLPKRWVVGRSFSWLEKNRRLWKNCERKLSTSLQMVALAFLGVLLRRL